MNKIFKIAKRIANSFEDLEEDSFEDLEEEPKYDDYIFGIIDGASELGITLTKENVEQALKDTGLSADEISLNQPVFPTGKPLEPGVYTFYKGGEIGEQLGFVSDDKKHAENWGLTTEITVECTGKFNDKWSYVHDWDGHPQLVPPGPECSKVNPGDFLILKNGVVHNSRTS
jgi:hypothetical protein